MKSAEGGTARIPPWPRRPARRGAEVEFLPAALEIIEAPASPAGRAIAATIILFFVAALVWATFGSVDIIATAPGKIVPTGRSKVGEFRGHNTKLAWGPPRQCGTLKPTPTVGVGYTLSQRDLPIPDGAQITSTEPATEPGALVQFDSRLRQWLAAPSRKPTQLSANLVEWTPKVRQR